MHYNFAHSNILLIITPRIILKGIITYNAKHNVHDIYTIQSIISYTFLSPLYPLQRYVRVTFFSYVARSQINYRSRRREKKSYKPLLHFRHAAHPRIEKESKKSLSNRFASVVLDRKSGASNV